MSQERLVLKSLFLFFRYKINTPCPPPPPPLRVKAKTLVTNFYGDATKMYSNVVQLYLLKHL